MTRRVLALLAGLGLAGPAGAQTPEPAPPAAVDSVAPAPAAYSDTTSRRFRLTAGRGRLVLENGERVTILDGGVRLVSDSTTIDSRRARAYRAREHAFFYEDVVVRDGGLEIRGREGEYSRREDIATLLGDVVARDARGTMRADRMRYWRADSVLRLWGHVDFQDEKNRVQADSAVYRQVDGRGQAWGNVVLTDLETGSVARGPRADYDRTTGAVRLVERPRMVVRERDRADTDIDADEVESNRDRSVLRARGGVRLRRGDTTAAADSAVLRRPDGIVLLRGRPELRQGSTRMLGREIDVHYEGDEVRRVEVRRAARLVQTRADTTLVPDANEVLGDSAKLEFEGGKLRRAVVVGTASSRYVPTETQPDRISQNEAQADSIVMLFDAATDIEEVIFVGNASGIYRFYEGDLGALSRPVAATYDSAFGVVRGDTTRFDFRRQAEVVEYHAERIFYLARQNDLLLQDAAEVQYQGRALRAGRIRYDADTDELDASERPALDEADSRMYGDEMGYDMGTRRAWVRGASTTFDRGYYSGGALRKYEEHVLQVAHGSYTTCDLARPHYRFECDEMKIYLGEKVVGRPVRLYLGNVPIGWLPFIVNSIDTKRHSGFLQPDIEFGVGSNTRYIRGLDYYWAASPYFDFIFSGDYTERSRPSRASVESVIETPDTRSFGMRIDGRYKLRYKFEGLARYSFRNDIGTDAFFWTLQGSHNQRLGERATLTGSLDYASNSRAVRQVSETTDYERSLTRQLTSAGTLNRPGDLVSLNLGVRRTQLVDPSATYVGNVVTSTLPSASVTFRSVRLGPAPRDREHPGWRGFLHELQLRPGVNVTRTTADVRVARLASEIPPGGVALVDSFRIKKFAVVSASTGATLNRAFNAGFVKVNPSVNYTETYVNNDTIPDVIEKNSTRTFSTGLGMSTTFYGLFHPKRLGIEAVRHRIEPVVGVSYRPEIAGQQRRATGVSLSLANVLDAKLLRDGKERRIDGVLAWSLSTTYSPTVLGGPGQPDRKFTNISSLIEINRSGPLRLTISQTFDPYAGKVLDTRIPFGFRLAGRFGYGDTGLEAEERNRVVEEEGAAAADTLGSVPRLETPEPLEDLRPVQVGPDGSLGWDLSMSYSLVRIGGATQNARVGLGFGIDVTKSWNIQYRTAFDARTHSLVNPDIRITRDLHCWKAQFSRILAYDGWRYYFRIYVDRHGEDMFLESGDRAMRY